MPDVSIFSTTNFNPNSLPEQSVVVDHDGLIDAGPISDPITLGYTAEAMDNWMEQGFASFGYGWLIYDVQAQFADATYYWTINVGVTEGGNTTVYDEHGIKGGNGSEVIYDLSGDDIVNTGGGADLIVNVGGNNAIAAGKGDDVVLTGTGDDVVKAGGGHDYVLTMEGEDAIKAGGGRDTIESGSGADLILGEGGHDRIDGGADDDVLNGGNGRDTFVFAVGSGSDIVEDFDAGRDTLEISTLMGASGFADIQNASAQSGADLVITLGADAITLEGVTINDLSASDFAFV